MDQGHMHSGKIEVECASVYSDPCAGAHGGQKRASNPSAAGVRVSLDQNSGPLQEQQVLLTADTPALRSFIKEEKDTPMCGRGLETWGRREAQKEPWFTRLLTF